MKFNLILAKTQSNGIGYQGGLPWNLKKELAYFKQMTKKVEDNAKQNAVIMGRVTWEESMPDAFKPLPGRLNFVLSSKEMPNLHPDAVHCFNLQEVIKKLSSATLADKIETAWVIGGAKLYESVIAAKLCHRIYVTEIMADFPCDTFVNINLNGFRQVIDPAVPADVQEENGVKYMFKVYEELPQVKFKNTRVKSD